MKIFAISGSLRPESANTRVLHALVPLCPVGVELTVHNSLDDLPHFSPERDRDPAPSAVRSLRDQIARADAVVFCTPEYAHGMPGVLKNGLDWLVSSGELIGKPVSVLSASPSDGGGVRAHAWLTQVLTVLSANIVGKASFSIGLVRTRMDTGGNITDIATRDALQSALDALITVAKDAPPAALPAAE